MTQLIEIVIAPDGTTRLETKGFTGESFRQASRFMEAALGCVSQEQLTAEFHLAQTSQETNTRQQ